MTSVDSDQGFMTTETQGNRAMVRTTTTATAQALWRLGTQEKLKMTLSRLIMDQLMVSKRLALASSLQDQCIDFASPHISSPVSRLSRKAQRSKRRKIYLLQGGPSAYHKLRSSQQHNESPDRMHSGSPRVDTVEALSNEKALDGYQGG